MPLSGSMQFLWEQRATIARAAGRGVRERFGGSALGPLWLVLKPAVLVALFWAVFGKLLGGQALPGRGGYVAYLCAGLIPWMAFDEALRSGTQLFATNAHIFRSYPVRGEFLAAVKVSELAFAFALSLGIVLALFAALGAFPPLQGLLWLVVLWAAQWVALYGLVLLAATVQPFVPDFTHALDAALPILFWTAPIVYTEDVLPETLRPVLVFNPITHWIGAYQRVLYEGRAPEFAALVVVGTSALLACWAGTRVYKARRGLIADQF